jgi:hypothetical protein
MLKMTHQLSHLIEKVESLRLHIEVFQIALYETNIDFTMLFAWFSNMIQLLSRTFDIPY